MWARLPPEMSRSSRRPRFTLLLRLAPLVAAALVLLTARPAHAFQRQWHLGGELGFATFKGSASSFNPAATVYAAYGLSDMFDVRLELTASRHEFFPGEHTGVYSASAGLAYKLDVIQWVPYAALLVGYYRFGGLVPLDRNQNELGASLAGGLEYEVSRSFGVGAEIRYHAFMGDLPTSLGDTPYFTGMLGAEYTWGW
jgi:Outer membrane protein beta-barrel domain